VAAAVVVVVATVDMAPAVAADHAGPIPDNPKNAYPLEPRHIRLTEFVSASGILFSIGPPFGGGAAWSISL
jgi:hypothetical protein